MQGWALQSLLEPGAETISLQIHLCQDATGVETKGRTAPWLMSHRLQVSQGFLRLAAQVRGREERHRRKARHHLGPQKREHSHFSKLTVAFRLLIQDYFFSYQFHILHELNQLPIFSSKCGRLVSSAKQKCGRMEYVFVKVPGKSGERSQALEGRRVDRKGQNYIVLGS